MFSLMPAGPFEFEEKQSTARKCVVAARASVQVPTCNSVHGSGASAPLNQIHGLAKICWNILIKDYNLDESCTVITDGGGGGVEAETPPGS